MKIFRVGVYPEVCGVPGKELAPERKEAEDAILAHCTSILQIAQGYTEDLSLLSISIFPQLRHGVIQVVDLSEEYLNGTGDQSTRIDFSAEEVNGDE